MYAIFAPCKVSFYRRKSVISCNAQDNGRNCFSRERLFCVSASLLKRRMASQPGPYPTLVKAP